MNAAPVSRLLLPAIAAALTALLVWLAFFWDPGTATAPAGARPHLATRPGGGEFTLSGARGPVSLADYRGKVLVLYFGYTYCPDVCPTSLALLAQGLAELTPVEAAQTRGLFISVDPERDTVERLAAYAPFFHPILEGATGTPEAVAAAARAYGVSYARQPANADGHYVVDHSSATYVVAPDGRLAEILPHDTPPAAIAAAIRKQLGSR